MEKTECEFKVLSIDDLNKKEESCKVYLSRDRQEEIKKLMFSALEDPRTKYEPQSMDDLENYWKNRHGC